MSLRTAILAAAALFCMTLYASPGHANTYYVSGANGSGATCAVDAPCATLPFALTVATVGDTIICLSPPAADGNLNIIKSVTIDCSAARASVGDATFDAGSIVINIAPSSADPLRLVRLRGLTIDGLANPTRFVDRAIDIQSAAAVYIEDCLIANYIQQGIRDHRTGGQTKLFIKDTVISGIGGAGIVAVSAVVGITTLDNVTSQNNAYGIAIGNGNNVEIRNSAFSGNSAAGIEGDPGSHVVVNNSTISHNNIGIQSTSSIRLYNNSISFNNTAFSGLASTMGLNRYSSNVSMGTTPSVIPNAPADIGP